MISFFFLLGMWMIVSSDFVTLFRPFNFHLLPPSFTSPSSLQRDLFPSRSGAFPRVLLLVLCTLSLSFWFPGYGCRRSWLSNKGCTLQAFPSNQWPSSFPKQFQSKKRNDLWKEENKNASKVDSCILQNICATMITNTFRIFGWLITTDVSQGLWHCSPSKEHNGSKLKVNKKGNMLQVLSTFICWCFRVLKFSRVQEERVKMKQN